MTISLASRLLSELQMTTGAISRAVTKGIIKIREIREMAVLEKIWTCGSLEMAEPPH